MRANYLVLTLLMALVTLLFFTTSASMINKNLTRIDRKDREIRREQDKLNSAKVLNDELKEVSLVIRNSLTQNRELSTDEASEFLRELSELATKLSIAVHSIFPRVAMTNNATRSIEQLYTMDIECTYVQMGQFLASLESYDYIVKVNTLEVRPQTDKFRETENGTREVLYKVILELSIFKIVKEA